MPWRPPEKMRKASTKSDFCHRLRAQKAQEGLSTHKRSSTTCAASFSIRASSPGYLAQIWEKAISHLRLRTVTAPLATDRLQSLIDTGLNDMPTTEDRFSPPLPPSPPPPTVAAAGAAGDRSRRKF
jgi:hypothetical protein